MTVWARAWQDSASARWTRRVAGESLVLRPFWWARTLIRAVQEGLVRARAGSGLVGLLAGLGNRPSETLDADVARVVADSRLAAGGTAAASWWRTAWTHGHIGAFVRQLSALPPSATRQVVGWALIGAVVTHLGGGLLLDASASLIQWMGRALLVGLGLWLLRPPRDVGE